MRITLDVNAGGPPHFGDILFTSRSRYLIVDVRRVRSRVHPSRWALQVERVGEDVETTGRMVRLTWHPRGPKRALTRPPRRG